ncbi:sensor histidine kinase [Flavisolibacter nicotianae]|uniref:sensor histidine kinase n=1 Tax=Flavisolibacter nicotianae TaxID=2364882 RepID=UPI000EB328DE|nr:ATP-binding protein [Flavisolibacter nicotianae]
MMNETQYDTELFAEVYDVHPQAIVWFRPIWNSDHSAIVDFAFSYCNDEGLRYLGVTRDQQQQLRVSDTVTLTDPLRPKVLAELVDVYTTGQTAESNIYNPALNKYARVLRTKLRGGVLTILQDRTEEYRIIRQLEQQANELKVRDDLLENLLKHSPAGISVTKVIRNEQGKVVDGRTLLANEMAAQLLHQSRETFLSQTVVQLDPTILESPLYQLSIRTLETGEPFHTQYYVASARKWIELSVARMENDHLINIFTDVTDTKTAQLKMENSAERLKAVFNASPSGMFTFAPVFDTKGEVVDFCFVITNPTFAAYAGQTPETLQGGLGSTFFPGYLYNGVFEMYKQTYLTGATLRQDIHYNVDGHDLYLDLLSTKVQDEVLVTFTDYTIARKAQIQQEKLVKELQRSNENLEEFAHAASHDLKEPIRKISVFCDRLMHSLDDRMDDMEKSMFERMSKAANRMMLLVDDLLNYSHAGLKPAELEEVDLNKKVTLVLHDLEVAIEQKNAIVSVDQLPVVKGYRRQLQQLFQNLISNALKYSNPGVPPEIHIGYRLVKGADIPFETSPANKEKDYHLIEISDNGIGFEPQYAERIFQMFQRLHGRAEYDGTGIGLSIARKVVTNHNGFIWADGEVDKGATFHIAFEK